MDVLIIILVVMELLFPACVTVKRVFICFYL